MRKILSILAIVALTAATAPCANAAFGAPKNQQTQSTSKQDSGSKQKQKTGGFGGGASIGITRDAAPVKTAKQKQDNPVVAPVFSDNRATTGSSNAPQPTRNAALPPTTNSYSYQSSTRRQQELREQQLHEESMRLQAEAQRLRDRQRVLDMQQSAGSLSNATNVAVGAAAGYAAGRMSGQHTAPVTIVNGGTYAPPPVANVNQGNTGYYSPPNQPYSGSVVPSQGQPQVPHEEKSSGGFMLVFGWLCFLGILSFVG